MFAHFRQEVEPFPCHTTIIKTNLFIGNKLGRRKNGLSQLSPLHQTRSKAWSSRCPLCWRVWSEPARGFLKSASHQKISLGFSTLLDLAIWVLQNCVPPNLILKWWSKSVKIWLRKTPPWFQSCWERCSAFSTAASSIHISSCSLLSMERPRFWILVFGIMILDYNYSRGWCWLSKYIIWTKQ